MKISHEDFYMYQVRIYTKRMIFLKEKDYNSANAIKENILAIEEEIQNTLSKMVEDDTPDLDMDLSFYEEHL